MTFPFPFFVPKRSLTQTLISSGAGTAIGSMSNLAAAFDGNTSQSRSSACNTGVSASGFANTVGKDWGSGNTKLLGRWIAYGTSDEGVLAGLATGVKLQGSNDNSTWVDLDSFTSSTGAGGVYDRSGSIDLSTAYRYHRVNIQGNGGNSCGIAEVVWYELL